MVGAHPFAKNSGFFGGLQLFLFRRKQSPRRFQRLFNSTRTSQRSYLTTVGSQDRRQVRSELPTNTFRHTNFALALIVEIYMLLRKKMKKLIIYILLYLYSPCRYGLFNKCRSFRGCQLYHHMLNCFGTTDGERKTIALNFDNK